MKNRLYSPKVMKEVLERHGFKFSKGLGQNFLTDGNIIDKICDGSEINDEDYCLEIGPGIGVLTQGLCERARKVVAIELDDRLLPILNETLEEYDNFEVIHGDVLKVDLEKIFEEKFENKKVKIAANLPYYITTPIIMKFLESKLNVDKIVVMVQKEVALRMKSEPGSKDYGALSVAVQYYSDPKIIANVPSTVFIPKPNVDSAVIMLDVYDEPKVKVQNEKILFEVVKGAFGKRRKTLTNALSSCSLGISKEFTRNMLENLGFDPNIRGERLSIEEFAKISNYISENNE